MTVHLTIAKTFMNTRAISYARDFNKIFQGHIFYIKFIVVVVSK